MAATVPATTAFAAMLPAFPSRPEGTVSEDGLLQGEGRQQTSWPGPLSGLQGEEDAGAPEVVVGGLRKCWIIGAQIQEHHVRPCEPV